MEKYSNYKNSGIEWIGDIPEHWEIKRMKYLCDIGTGDKDTENREENGKYPFYVRSQTIERISSYSFDGEAILTAGDGVGVCKVWHYVNEKFAYHQRVYRMSHFQNIIGKYLFYYLKENFEKEVKKLSAKSTVDSLRRPMFQNFKVCYGTAEEQISIVNYLDKKTSEIDTLIFKKKALIDLLTEELNAIINHTITKGINLKAKLKYSGIEWIGDIPEHWGTKRIRFLFSIVKRIAGTLGFNVLSVTQKGIRLKDIESGTGQLSMDYSKYQLVNKGDFIMNHMDLLTGYVDISKYEGVTSPDYRVFRLQDSNNFSEYFLYHFQNCYRNKIFYPLGQGSAQVGRWRLPAINFNNFILPVPPINEQIEICKFIKAKVEEIEIIISKTQKEIELLNEYKTALISEVVTGKVDVRGGFSLTNFYQHGKGHTHGRNF